MDMPAPVRVGTSAVFPYNEYVIFGGAENAALPYAVAERTAWDNANRQYTVARPTKDSIPWPATVILPGSLVNYGANLLGVASFIWDTRPLLVSLTADTVAPVIGDSLGTVKDTWGLKTGNSGFICVGIAVDSGVGAGLRLVYVRPGSAGGGSAFAIVQTTSAGSAGAVTAEAITMNANPADTPNFTLSGTSLALNYFHL